METKNKVEITIGRQSFTILTEEPAEKTAALATQIDDRLSEIMADGKVTYPDDPRWFGDR